ncbi:hypothetical protein PV703_10325 [Streptomyces sp. ME01-24h]|nr:hypothetical protein [Streptomyces sp. ME01-24h]
MALDVPPDADLPRIRKLLEHGESEGMVALGRSGRHRRLASHSHCLTAVWAGIVSLGRHVLSRDCCPPIRRCST